LRSSHTLTISLLRTAQLPLESFLARNTHGRILASLSPVLAATHTHPLSHEGMPDRFVAQQEAERPGPPLGIKANQAIVAGEPAPPRGTNSALVRGRLALSFVRSQSQMSGLLHAGVASSGGGCGGHRGKCSIGWRRRRSGCNAWPGGDGTDRGRPGSMSRRHSRRRGRSTVNRWGGARRRNGFWRRSRRRCRSSRSRAQILLMNPHEAA